MIEHATFKNFILDPILGVRGSLVKCINLSSHEEGCRLVLQILHDLSILAVRLISVLQYLLKTLSRRAHYEVTDPLPNDLSVYRGSKITDLESEIVNQFAFSWETLTLLAKPASVFWLDSLAALGAGLVVHCSGGHDIENIPSHFKNKRFWFVSAHETLVLLDLQLHLNKKDFRIVILRWDSMVVVFC